MLYKVEYEYNYFKTTKIITPKKGSTIWYGGVKQELVWISPVDGKEIILLNPTYGYITRITLPFDAEQNECVYKLKDSKKQYKLDENFQYKMSSRFCEKSVTPVKIGESLMAYDNHNERKTSLIFIKETDTDFKFFDSLSEYEVTISKGMIGKTRSYNFDVELLVK